MQQFIAKFEKDIQGVLSGFDRVLFRGSLRRLTHSLGMKWYLAQNDILCKQYEDHVKAISQKVKKAALAPFQQQGLLVRHVHGGDDKEAIARAFAAERNRFARQDSASTPPPAQTGPATPCCKLPLPRCLPLFRHTKC